MKYLPHLSFLPETEIVLDEGGKLIRNKHLFYSLLMAAGVSVKDGLQRMDRTEKCKQHSTNKIVVHPSTFTMKPPH